MKFLSRKNVTAEVGSAMPISDVFSLGAGALSCDASAVESFVPSPKRRSAALRVTSASREISIKTLPDLQPVVFIRRHSSFLRVTDLNIAKMTSSDSMTTSCDTFSESDSPVNSDSDHPDSNGSQTPHNYPNFHFVSVDPPPGVLLDPAERWVALDNGVGAHAPIAPAAVEALVHAAVQSTVQNQTMWTPDAKTAKLQHQDANSWCECTWKNNDSISSTLPCWQNIPAPGTFEELQVLVWSGNFSHGGYGSDLPAVRAAGLIPMSALHLLQLLVDSSRVSFYNKLSLGRTDVMVLQDQLEDGTFGGITKVMRSESRPPLLRKTLQFNTLLHARKYGIGGYTIVTRAVEGGPPPLTDLGGSSMSTILKSEILLGVNIILPISETRCLLTTVHHIRSPMVPMMIAKRIGLQASVNFIHDLRAVC
jgi:hypothetical protein